jgi:hypothetical protein
MGLRLTLSALAAAAVLTTIAAVRQAPADVNQLYELAAALANKSAPIAISTATTTELIAAPAGTEPGGGTRYVEVSAYEVMAGGTGNIQFVTGTKTTTACDTGATNVTGNFPLTAQARIQGGNGFGPLWTLPAGQELCAVTSAAVSMAGYLTYRVK